MLDDVLEVVLDVWDAVDMVDIGRGLLGGKNKKRQPGEAESDPSAGADPWEQKQEKPAWEK